MGEIIIPTKGGDSYKAYMAMPDKIPAPTVIVIQEIFGVNQVMRDKCDWLAKQGFIAVCPDLFWRIEPGIELTDQTDEEWTRAFELYKAFDEAKGVEDIRAAIHTMRGHAECNGKVGVLGYCLGGKLAYLAATRSSSQASVGYYGVGIQDALKEAENIKEPILLHIAEEDEFVDKKAQKKIQKKLSSNSRAMLFSYPGANHAFSRQGGAHYNAEAAKLADQRSLDFLKQNLAA